MRERARHRNLLRAVRRVGDGKGAELLPARREVLREELPDLGIRQRSGPERLGIVSGHPRIVELAGDVKGEHELVLETHARAGIEQQGEGDRLGLVEKMRDVLEDAVLEDVKVFLLESGDVPARAIGDRDGQQHHVRAAVEDLRRSGVKRNSEVAEARLERDGKLSVLKR